MLQAADDELSSEMHCRMGLDSRDYWGDEMDAGLPFLLP